MNNSENYLENSDILEIKRIIYVKEGDVPRISTIMAQPKKIKISG